MNIPVIEGLIRRRLLVNFRADPDRIQAILPAPFRLKLHQEHAVVGVCLIRLEQIRPLALPLPVGINSENAAHRIAVLWDDETGQTREGVYIPRRDTGSWMNHFAGGRLFPGQHHLADFRVRTSADKIDFAMISHDKQVEVRLSGRTTTSWPADSCFASLDESSAFFACGSLGYSPRHNSRLLDGLLLRTRHWQVEALQLEHVFSSFYQDKKVFPPGSIHYDHTLLMRNIPHEWHSVRTIEAESLT